MLILFIEIDNVQCALIKIFYLRLVPIISDSHSKESIRFLRIIDRQSASGPETVAADAVGFPYGAELDIRTVT